MCVCVCVCVCVCTCVSIPRFYTCGYATTVCHLWPNSDNLADVRSPLTGDSGAAASPHTLASSGPLETTSPSSPRNNLTNSAPTSRLSRINTSSSSSSSPLLVDTGTVFCTDMGTTNWRAGQIEGISLSSFTHNVTGIKLIHSACTYVHSIQYSTGTGVHHVNAET